MKGRLLFLAGLATGYLLGSRLLVRGYDRLTAKVRDIWGDPNLQRVVAETEQATRDAAALAQSKVSELLDQASTAVGTERERAVSAVEDATKKMSNAVKDASQSDTD